MADLPDTSTVTKPVTNVAAGMKGSVKRLVAFAKKRPAIVALMVGAVVLMVLILRRRGGLGAGARTRAGEGDPLLELGASGVPTEEMGGLVPGAYPSPMPYYEDTGEYYTPPPAYEPFYDPFYEPAFQPFVDYGASTVMAETLTDAGRTTYRGGTVYTEPTARREQAESQITRLLRQAKAKLTTPTAPTRQTTTPTWYEAAQGRRPGGRLGEPDFTPFVEAARSRRPGGRLGQPDVPRLIEEAKARRPFARLTAAAKKTYQPVKLSSARIAALSQPERH